MKVLVACEYSGIVRDAFIRKGHDAMSCDLLPTETPGPHHQGDVFDLDLSRFDLAIFHPPCTYLCASGMHWTSRGLRDPKLTEDAVAFVEAIMSAPVGKIAVENPKGCISTRIDATKYGFHSRKATQYIQPYEFGHDASKSTGLWLKNLPPLRPTRMIPGRLVCCGNEIGELETCGVCMGERKPRRVWANQTNSGQNKLGPSKDRWKERSKTYQGIANAMADQWS